MIKNIYILLPGTGSRFDCGGTQLAVLFSTLMNSHCPTEVVSYIDRQDNLLYFNDVLEQKDNSGALFIVTWGPDIEVQTQNILERGLRVLSLNQSTKWHSVLPSNVASICTSRYIMSSRVLLNPNNPCYLLNPVVKVSVSDDSFSVLQRDIDVLFVERKSPPYLRESLIPELRKHCHVHTVNAFIPKNELFSLYQRAKVYVYYSDPEWAIEGFGLQPLEAMFSGCVVFSNLHGGLSDYLTPLKNMYPIGMTSLQFDVGQVLNKVKNGWGALDKSNVESLRRRYGEESFHQQFEKILSNLNEFYTHLEEFPASS